RPSAGGPLPPTAYRCLRQHGCLGRNTDPRAERHRRQQSQYADLRPLRRGRGGHELLAGPRRWRSIPASGRRHDLRGHQRAMRYSLHLPPYRHAAGRRPNCVEPADPHRSIFNAATRAAAPGVV
nr:hypothetical protein [Tanacetum cinerariifolium]